MLFAPRSTCAACPRPRVGVGARLTLDGRRVRASWSPAWAVSLLRTLAGQVATAVVVSTAAVIFVVASAPPAAAAIQVAQTYADDTDGDQDDMAIWVHPVDPSLSTIISSDKDSGTVYVYDLDGTVVQAIDSPKPGNIDIRYGFQVGNDCLDVVALNERDDESIHVYAVDPFTRRLTRIDDGTIATGQNYGFTLYRHGDGRLFAYTGPDSGSAVIEQYELVDDGNGQVTGSPTGWQFPASTVEGMVGDDETGYVFLSEENVGVWRVDALDDMDQTLIAAVGDASGLTADVEGIAIYHTAGARGYIIVSSQLASKYTIVERQPPHLPVGEFQVEGVGSTDGLDVLNLGLNATFPQGIFTFHNGAGGCGVDGCPIQAVRWEDIVTEVGTLVIDTSSWDPRQSNRSCWCDFPPSGQCCDPVDGGLAAIDDGNSCTHDVCHVDGSVVHITAAEGSACDDGQACTIGESCAVGVCEGGIPVECGDAVACTSDSCDPGTGLCLNVADDGVCDDGVFCNGAESCDELLGCVSAAVADCDDQVACTVDSCNEQAGACDNVSVDETCEDGVFCNGAEFCDPFLDCQAAPAPCPGPVCDEGADDCVPCIEDADCDDGFDCTADTCNVTTGTCEHAADDAGCDDGLLCTGIEVCHPLAGCQPGSDWCGETPPNFKVAFFGDQSLNPGAAAVLQLVLDEGADAVMHGGDFDYHHDPQAWEDQLDSILGPDFPYFGCVGNHDEDSFYIADGYQERLAARMDRLGIPWQGDLGVKSSFMYEGIFFVLTAPGSFGGGDGLYDVYIRDQLAADDSIWRVSSWHANQNKMQVGGKPDETGWGVYEEARRGGAIIATGHEHSYSRTHLMAEMENTVVASTDSTLVLASDDPETAADEGRTFAFVSGLGGKTIRDQERDDPWWASVYSETQDANHGSLFGVFNYQGDPRRAYFYFKDIDGVIADEFFVTSTMGADPGPGCDDGVDCTLDSFNYLTEECEHVVDDGLCADGDVCNGSETCSALTGCQAGVLLACGDSTFCNGAELCDPELGCGSGLDPCPLSVCDEDAMACVACTSDAECDDGLYCSGVETCLASGLCQLAAPIVCDDGLSCTDDWCDEGTESCGVAMVESACDDGNECTVDTCHRDLDCRNVDVCTGGSAELDQAWAGGASGSDTVSTEDPVIAVPDRLYLAAIATRLDVEVVDVEGLGLNWTRVGAQCAARGQTGIELWRAAGEPTGDDVVTATMASSTQHAVITVTSYSGTADGSAIGAVASANTAGAAGACSGGSDGNSYSVDLAAADGSVAYVAVAMRNRMHTAGPGFTEAAETRQGSGGGTTSSAVAHGPVGAGAPLDVNGSFNSSVDWAVVTAALEPAGVAACESDVECDDGWFCNGAEVCTATGSCAAGVAPTCDDGVPCTVDVCDLAINACRGLPDDGRCDNGVFCDGVERCDAVSDCQAGTVPDCDDGIACTVDSCDGSADACDAAPVDAVCDDDSVCTADVCDLEAGCVNEPMDCGDGDACTADTCEPASGCQHDTVDCDDGDACTADTCDASTGCAYDPVVCDDGDACTADACDAATGCTTDPLDCDDASVCTTDSCDAATGCANDPIDCGDGDACTADTCEPASGCQHDTVDCDDGDACTADTCDAVGGCSNGPLDCDDDSVCTTDGCDASSGCTYETVDCSDGDACTADTCEPASGCRHDTVDCDDGSACTVDACDPVDGCTGEPVACDDGDACTADTCDQADGCQHGAVDCDDGDACTADACESASGCRHDTVACSDGDACTLDTCDAETGCAYGPVDCGDGDACTTDACDAVSGCEHGPLECDDGDACTADSCDGLTGCANDPIGCDDADACTTDTCDPASGCRHDAVVCDDADACTTDSCDGSTGCMNAPVDCGDNDACTVDTCDAAAGCANDFIECDDGDACTLDFCHRMLGCRNLETCTTSIIVLEELQSGASSGAATVATDAAVTASEGYLYLAAVASRFGTGVVGVSGLGLDWELVRDQCGGRAQSGVEVWQALGAPVGDGVVTAALAAAVPNAAIAVTVYSGVDANAPVGATVSLNTNGVDGACSGGVDGSAYSSQLTTAADGAVAYVAASMRNRQHGPGPGYTENAEVRQGTAGGTVSLAVADRLVDQASSVAVDGTFNSTVDWAAVAAVLVPASAAGCSGDADCDDGRFCNGAEVCDQTGDCQAGAAPSCDDGVSCTVDVCDWFSDGCHSDAADALCDNGLYCDGVEACDAVAGCLAGAPPVCDDGVGCTLDSCDESADGCTSVPEAAACDDGLFCNGVEVCDQALGCQQGVAPACDDGIACTLDSCNVGTDVCDNLPDDTACDDGLFCNGAELCDMVQGCDRGADPCPDEQCDESGDACVACLVDLDCDDGDACTMDSCDAGNTCHNGSLDCDDGDSCTTDTCDAGTGCANDAVDCNDGDACTTDTCDALTGCANDTVDCNDGDACTTDSCDAATGCANDTVDCDDDDACTTDSCDTATGCANDPVSCDDGDACTADACDAAAGCANDAVSCDDADACTTDSCDAATGCANDTVDCDDGDACTADTCDAVTGCANDVVSCDDADACTTDSCDAVTGCRHAPVDCSDADACTVNTCDALAGCTSDPLDCDDADACTTDSCEPASGCAHASVSCDDGDECTTDACDVASGCQYGVVDCDDADACTADGCDAATGCEYGPVDCSDGDACTIDACDVAAGCEYGLVDCDDGDACTADSCDPAAGCGNVDVCIAVPIELEQMHTGGSSAADTVSTDGAVTAVLDQLYLAAVAHKLDVDVTGVSGLGLTWTRVRSQCAGRGQTSVEVWQAIGLVAADGIVTASLASAVPNAVIAVTGYSGVDMAGPVGGVVSVNTNGAAGACAGGVDSNAYAASLTTTVDGSVAYVAAAMRNRQHTPGSGYSEHVELRQGTGGGTASAAVSDRPVASASAVAVEGSFNSSTDWAVVAAELVPATVVACASDAECDDGVFCNGAEACDPARGCQVGVAPSCDDGVSCTVDVCEPVADGCENTPDDAPCDDGLFCNGAESCTVDQGCTAGGDACPGEQCDELADECVECLLDADCGDGDACTTDVCDTQHECRNTVVDCNDDDACTTDTCDSVSGCSHDAISCDDGSACTMDTCDAVSGCSNDTVDCNDDDACTADACDTISGCSNDAISCDDGSACTTDTCEPVSGCSYEPVGCDDGDACTVDTCDTASGCGSDPVDCSDSDACTTDTCDPATGCAYGPVDCSDEDACTTDTCDTVAGCQRDPVDCSDDDACTVDTCDAASGCGSDPVDCNDSDACTTDTCEPATGCGYDPVDCGDDDACTVDTCDAAIGCGNDPVDCDDDDACTTDSCNAATGCGHAQVDCNDGDACTTDVCDAGAGCGYAPVDCSDGDACTTDSCDALSGCSSDSIECDDGDACTTDTCDTATGCGYGPVDCNDGDACTADTCDAASGCGSDPIECNDSDACTIDSCDAATGCGNDPVDCSDGDACTTDTCDAVSGCGYAPIDCDDGDACTADTCDAVSGCNSNVVDCDDGDACTTDTCDAVTGCGYGPIDCDDGDACTADTCDAASGCGYGTVDCDDGDVCTADTCDQALGCQHVDTCTPAEVTYEGVDVGTSSGSSVVVTDTVVPAVGDELYLVAVSTKSRVAVASVDGLGLSWSPIATQCSGRNQTGVEIWAAEGTASAAGVVTATLAKAPTSATLAVVRYSGASAAFAIGTVTSANTSGVAGACSGGSDSSSYSLGLTTTSPGSVVLGAVAMRNKTHTPSAVYTQRVDVRAGQGGGVASLAVMDTTVDVISSVAVEGAFSSNVDWAVVAVEIVP